jgi:membrane-bound metal-dependent hydrolase YbcI (DUF457 family)
MLLRTHIAIALLFIFLFLPNISHKLIFISVALIATLLPDLDTGFSTLGKHPVTGIIRFFVRHRGILHSFSFCVIISFLLAFFVPVLALPFFLGYGLHLFTDSFTIDGIRPFWPTKHLSKGLFKTGSLSETFVFIVLLIVDALALIFILYRMN